jgi:hypothetical protein
MLLTLFERSVMFMRDRAKCKPSRSVTQAKLLELPPVRQPSA